MNQCVFLVLCGVFFGSINASPYIHKYQHKHPLYDRGFYPDLQHNHLDSGAPKKEKKSTLELVHVIFRHGDRNPGIESLYPSNPYYDEKFYPEGYGQLTNDGKRTEYNLGRALRQRYNDFLGTSWNIKNLEARSTDYNRTKMSLELVLASLYPPKGSQAWSPLYWQPIPYNYVPKSLDKEILAFDACPKYEAMMNDLYKSPEISKYLQRYNETFEILSRHTNRKTDIIEAFYMYVGFLIQEELGYPLEKWTKAVYPHPLHSATVDMYHLMTNNTAMRRMISGYFLKKILADTKTKIDGGMNPAERKMFIYSAHEMNIATTLLSLEALKLSHVPPYGAYILFEVHNIDGVYGIKLFYQNYEHKHPMALKIPGCDYFCPYDDFYTLVEEILPTSDEDCFGKP